MADQPFISALRCLQSAMSPKDVLPTTRFAAGDQVHNSPTISLIFRSRSPFSCLTAWVCLVSSDYRDSPE
jgi:hypothetical protein